jgi:hypothetical protein
VQFKAEIRKFKSNRKPSEVREILDFGF